jgi:hypothetical protein
MDWKFWRKNEIAAAPNDGKTQRLEKARDIPMEVGRHLVVKQGLDPDWVWSLKCARKPRPDSKSAFDIRVFCSVTASQQGVKIRDYASLDNHADLIIFAGWYDKSTAIVQVEELIKKAV